MLWLCEEAKLQFDITRFNPQDFAMRISIVTPSYRGSQWLRLCVASVADQGVELEHIIQDAGSDDGTLDWLLADRRVRAHVERDQGMYDAIDRGFRKATGEIFGYLNCDEQYLPNCLRSVLAFFEQQPSVDVVFGDVIMADNHGGYVAHRKMQTPLKYHTWTCHLSTLSCGMFFRRSLYLDRGFRFDGALRDVGDGEWMVRLLRAGITMAALGVFTSVFTLTGVNMSTGMNARRENRELRRRAPVWARMARPLLVAHHRFRRWKGGMYVRTPFAFSLFTLDSPDKRVVREVLEPRPRFST
jgi:glycosyltransferase involved in cell wall biosynthesis